jgi:hypothetical protein
MSESPCVIHEKVHHAPRITVWVTISSHGLLRPILFEETVNSERYLTFNSWSAPIGAAMSMVEMDEVHRFVHAGI